MTPAEAIENAYAVTFLIVSKDGRFWIWKGGWPLIPVEVTAQTEAAQ